MQEPLSNAFAQQPASLEGNVPTSEQPNMFAELELPAPAPQQAAPSASPEQPAPNMFASLAEEPPVGDVGLEGDALPPQSFTENNFTVEGIKEQLGEMTTRFKNAFTITNKESLGVLRDSGIFQKVRVGDDGDVEVIRKGREGFEKFDRDKIELIGDVVDGSRMAMEAVVENALRVGGAAAGALGGTAAAPVVGTVAGGLGGAALGGATGAVVATNLADQFAEKILGIQRDESRSRVKENSIAATFGGFFSLLGARTTRAMATKAADKLEATKTLEFARDKAAEAVEHITKVKDSGLKLDSATRKFSLDPQQITGGAVPDVNVMAKEMSRQTGFQNFRREQGDMLKGAYQSFIDSIGAQAGRSAELGKDFVLKAKDIRQVEGKLIGNFRKLAQKELVGQPQQAPLLTDAIQEATESLGGVGSFANLTSKGRKEMAAKIQSEFPAFTPAQSNIMVKTFEDITKKMTKGQGMIGVDDAEKIYTGLRKQIDNSINTASGRSFGLALVRVKDAIRDDWTQMIGNVLPEGQKAAYSKSMARYSEVLGAHKVLKSALQTEDISRDALLSKLFEGKASLKFARSARTLIDESDPKFWNELTGEFFSKMQGKHTNEFGEVSWAAMGKQWRGLGKEMQQELVTGAGVSKAGLDSLMHIGSLHQKTNFKALPTKTRVGIFKQLVNVIAPTFIGTKASAAQGLMERMGKEQSMMVWLKDGGLEETLKQMPVLKETKRQGLRAWVNNWTPQLVKQGAKTEVRQKAQQVGNE